MQGSSKKVSFIKLSNKLLWIKDKGHNEKSLIDQVSELLQDSSTAAMIPEILAQLNWRVNKMNTCTFTINGLIRACGYIPKSGNNKSINKFREVLILLHEWDYLKNLALGIKENLETISPSTELTCSIDNKFIKKNGEDIEFFIVDLNTYATLFNLNSSSAFRRNLINIYFYLSARIPASTEEDTTNDHFCYVGQGEIASSLQITRNTVLTCLKALEDSKLIYFGNIGNVSGINRKGEVGTIFGKTVYAKTLKDLETGLSYSKSFYSSKGWLTSSDDIIKDKAKSILKKSRSKGGKKKCNP